MHLMQGSKGCGRGKRDGEERVVGGGGSIALLGLAILIVAWSLAPSRAVMLG